MDNLTPNDAKTLVAVFDLLDRHGKIAEHIADGRIGNAMAVVNIIVLEYMEKLCDEIESPTLKAEIELQLASTRIENEKFSDIMRTLDDIRKLRDFRKD